VKLYNAFQMNLHSASFAVLLVLLVSLILHGGTTEPAKQWRFDFGTQRVMSGYIGVTPQARYSDEAGYGFESGDEIREMDRGGDALLGDFCTSSKPFRFSVRLPEGNYRVKVILGDASGKSDTAIKAESRRLMTMPAQLHSAHGEKSFIVNVRHKTIAGGGEVKLKRDRNSLNWDEKLTLEFAGANPCLCGLEIEPALDAITIYIAGDSTVTDQTNEPWAGWGQMLPRFFVPPVAIANHAESGESLRSFVGEKRLAKIMSQIKAGDYLFIQFGHNDMKEKGEGVGAFSSFSDSLKQFVAEARKREAQVVLLTPMNRRSFDSSGKITNTHGDYPQAMRRVARELNVPLIDLHSMSKTLYEAWGPEQSTRAFVHYPAGTFPGQDQALKDNSHFNNYGAYELARCVAEGIRQNKLPIERYLAQDVTPFEPAHPDAVESVPIPASALIGTTTAPAGR
jgi:lysophospholipase L1-like esterase